MRSRSNRGSSAPCVESTLRTPPAIENNWLGGILEVDGGTVVVAATGNSETEHQAGAAYVFEFGPQGLEQVDVFYSPRPEMLGGFARDVDVGGDWILVGFEAVLPGTSWNFQAFFHEPDPLPGGSSFNLSDGVSITLAARAWRA